MSNFLRFKCDTLPQYKIIAFLRQTGLLDEDWASVELLDETHVKVSDGSGYYTTFAYCGLDDIQEVDAN